MIGPISNAAVKKPLTGTSGSTNAKTDNQKSSGAPNEAHQPAAFDAAKTGSGVASSPALLGNQPSGTHSPGSPAQPAEVAGTLVKLLQQVQGALDPKTQFQLGQSLKARSASSRQLKSLPPQQPESPAGAQTPPVAFDTESAPPPAGAMPAQAVQARVLNTDPPPASTTETEASSSSSPAGPSTPTGQATPTPSTAVAGVPDYVYTNAEGKQQVDPAKFNEEFAQYNSTLPPDQQLTPSQLEDAEVLNTQMIEGAPHKDKNGKLIPKGNLNGDLLEGTDPANITALESALSPEKAMQAFKFQTGLQSTGQVKISSHALYRSFIDPTRTGGLPPDVLADPAKLRDTLLNDAPDTWWKDNSGRVSNILRDGSGNAIGQLGIRTGTDGVIEVTTYIPIGNKKKGRFAPGKKNFLQPGNTPAAQALPPAVAPNTPGAATETTPSTSTAAEGSATTGAAADTPASSGSTANGPVKLKGQLDGLTVNPEGQALFNNEVLGQMNPDGVIVTSKGVKIDSQGIATSVNGTRIGTYSPGESVEQGKPSIILDQPPDIRPPVSIWKPIQSTDPWINIK